MKTIIVLFLSIALLSCTKEVVKPEIKIKEWPDYIEVKPTVQPKRG